VTGVALGHVDLDERLRIGSFGIDLGLPRSVGRGSGTLERGPTDAAATWSRGGSAEGMSVPLGPARDSLHFAV